MLVATTGRCPRRAVLPSRVQARPWCRWEVGLPLWFRYRSRSVALVALLITACKDEFPNAPALALAIDTTAGWHDTVAVADVDTLQIKVALAGGGSVSGVQVHWESSNPTKLEVTRLELQAGQEKDTLTLQLRTVITAHARDSGVIITATVDRAGFERKAFSRKITLMERWIAVSAGAMHTCAIAADSSAYCWGAGDKGRLGRGRPLDSSVPVPVTGVGIFRFVAINAGEETSCGIVAEGVAYCWGAGIHGSLGNGDASEVDRFIPVQVSGPTLRSLDVGTVSCGLADDSTALCWGTNVSGQLGFNPNSNQSLSICLDVTPCSLVPRLVWVDLSTPTRYQAISVGDNHTCGLSASPQSGSAYCWGTGLQGALGNASTMFSPIPIPVSGGLAFGSLSAGGGHTCGIATSAITYCWGANSEGQLGSGTTRDTLTPVAVKGGSFAAITAGRQHTCAITALGAAFCWGMGSAGQLGNGATGRQTSPATVTGNLIFETISAGAFHTCGLAKGGALYCWGQGARGRLGNGSNGDRLTPTRVLEPQ